MLRRPKADLSALGVYVAISLAFFGWRLLPHPGRLDIGQGHDSLEFIWSFAWWTHAIGSPTNPFVTHVLYAPSGVNLTWTPTSPGLAVLFSPLTALVGPVASFNVAMLLAPAVSAWAAYLLCRRLTSSIWASLVGGFLYGFSTANLRQFLAGNLHVSAVFVLPLVALVLVRYFRSELSARGLAWRFGVLLAFQLSIFTEFALTLIIVLVLGLALGLALAPEARRRLLSAVVPVAAGCGVAAVLAAPFLVYLLIGFVPTRFTGSIRLWGTDPLGFLIPNKITGIGGEYFLSFANHTPNGDLAYLGAPTVLIILVFGVHGWRAPWTRFLIAALASCAVIALGISLSVEGHVLFTFPWSGVWNLPALDNVLPARFAIDIALLAGVIVAIWTDRTKGRFFPRPYVLPALAVAALVPAFWNPSEVFPGHPTRVAFFADGMDKTCFPPNETLLVFPFGDRGDSLVWQAESGFRFKLATDGLQPIPQSGKPIASFDADQIVSDMNTIDDGTPTVDRLLAFVSIHHVDRVVAAPEAGYPTPSQMRAFGSVQFVGGVFVAPACGQKPLTTRNLTKFVRQYRREETASRTRPAIGYCLPNEFTTLPQGLDPAGALAGAVRAIVVKAVGITCEPPPPGYTRHGFATGAVPPDTYAYYSP